MAKVKTDSIDEKVFTTKGSKIDEAAILSTGSESASSGFDPHFITEKIIEFGMALTGMPLYDYQKDSAYRIIHSVVAKEGETITMLFSRQCFGRGTMVQTYDFGVKGCKPVEEIKNGDYVCSPFNTAVEVKNYHSGTDEMFIVVPQSDFLYKPYKVNSQHVLAVYDLTDGQFKPITIDEYAYIPLEHKMKLRGYAVVDSEYVYYRFNVIPNGKGEYFGFEIDNDDHRFLLSDNTVIFNSGKSETMAFVIDTLCVILPVLGKVIPELAEYTTGFRVGLFAPQSDQVTTTYQRAMSRLKSSNAAMVMEDGDIDTKLIYDARLVLSNGSSLMGQTAAKTSKIESKTYDLIIIEEAQDTDDLVVSKSIESMGAATYATFVKLGTTGMRKGDFWYEIQRNIKRSTGAHKGKLRYHYEFNYLEIIKQKRAQYAKDGNLFHLNYEKFIKKQIEKRGIQSDSFKLAFALIWALEGGMFLSDADWNNMLNRKKNFIRVVEPNWDIRAGIDIAKDRASTVITIGRVIPEFVGVPPRKEVLQWVELKGMDYELQHQTIVQTLIDYGVSLVYIDYTGVGKPVVDRLTHAIGHFITVVPYTFSRPSKSEMWLALQADILAKRFVIPATQAARDTQEYKNAEIQFKGLTKRYEGGYLVAEKGSEHELDDVCDSSALFVMAGNAELTASTNVEFSEENPFYQNAGVLHTIQTTSW